MKQVLQNKFLIRSVIILILVISVITLVFGDQLFREKKVFDIQDRCGQFINLISHTVEDESACATRCRSQCDSIDYKFDKIEFIESETACHTCTCTCK